ncbi:aquaporin-like protein [Mycena filopes]|nr:aquaporin-like protein [Mycena filopes]
MATTFSDANNNGVVYMGDLNKRTAGFAGWERLRHGKLHWFVECFAEAMGVFMYVFAGVGSQAVFVIGGLSKQEGLSSILQIGFAYCGGIVLAVSICSATSGGHFNPCITIVQMLFKGFPPLKGLRYITAQILGGYIACLLVYAQYRVPLLELQAAIPAPVLATIQFTPNGPAGIFGFYLLPGSSLGLAFLNEFVADFFLAIVIFGCVDPSNVLVPPASAPFVIGLAYAVAIWGFSANGLAANSARDLGGRLAALTIWGKDAVGPYKAYCAITALTNIPATILGAIVYELVFVDSDRVVAQVHREYHDIHALHRRTGPAAIAGDANSSSSSDHNQKEHLGTVERV